MKEYRVLKNIRLTGGTIGLGESQAHDRRLNLKKISKGEFDIVKPVEFKAGEVVGFAKTPKVFMQHLISIADEAKAKSKAEAEAKGKAKAKEKADG